MYYFHKFTDLSCLCLAPDATQPLVETEIALIVNFFSAKFFYLSPGWFHSE